MGSETLRIMHNVTLNRSSFKKHATRHTKRNELVDRIGYGRMSSYETFPDFSTFSEHYKGHRNNVNKNNQNRKKE